MESFGSDSSRRGFSTGSKEDRKNKPSPLRIVKQELLPDRIRLSGSSIRTRDRVWSELSGPKHVGVPSTSKRRRISSRETCSRGHTEIRPEGCLSGSPSSRGSAGGDDFGDGVQEKQSLRRHRGLKATSALKVRKIRLRGLKSRSHRSAQETWGGPGQPGSFSLNRCSTKTRPSIYSIPDLARCSMPFASDGNSAATSRSCSSASVRPPGRACLLVPHIAVTSEVPSVEAGQHCLWVAIEVSGQLSQGHLGSLNIEPNQRTRSSNESRGETYSGM